MNHKSMIEKLKSEASNNSVLNSVLHMFAFRKRARRDLTVVGLRHRMLSEGFLYSDEQYESVIRSLADAGVGTLNTSGRGDVLGLKGITVTLQSLGKATCSPSGKLGALDRIKTKNRFQEVPNPPVSPITQKSPTVRPLKAIKEAKAPLVLTVLINDKPLNIKVPSDFEGQDFQTLLERLQDLPFDDRKAQK